MVPFKVSQEDLALKFLLADTNSNLISTPQESTFLMRLEAILPSECNTKGERTPQSHIQQGVMTPW